MAGLHGSISNEPKIVIVGAGSVGTTLAFSLIIRGLTSRIVLIDADEERAEGEVMDLNHAMPFSFPTKISVGNYSECADADIVVIAVDKGQKIEQSRLDLAEGNFQILKQIVPNISDYTSECVLLVVTNPLDVMTYAALKLSGLPKERVIGSGTILDSARLRYLLGEYFHVDARNIHAYIIGEHGDSEVPVWSLANIAGIRLKDYCSVRDIQYDQERFNAMFTNVRNAGYEIIRRKGRTYYAVALGLTKIVESIIRNENAVLTVSSLLEDYHGVNDVCLSAPSVINREGIREVIRLPLEEDEISKFQKSAASIKEVISRLRF